MKDYEVYIKIGERLLELRKNAGLTQTELANAVGLTQTLVAKYEKGVKRMPIENLRLFSEYFGVTMDYLSGDDEEEIITEDEFEMETPTEEMIKILESVEWTDNEAEQLMHYARYLISLRQLDNNDPREGLNSHIKRANNAKVYDGNSTYVRPKDENIR